MQPEKQEKPSIPQKAAAMPTPTPTPTPTEEASTAKSGEGVPVEPAPAPPSNMIIIKNISSKASQDDIATFFALCGPMTSFKREENNAIIEFETPDSRKIALNLDGTYLVDQAITVSPYPEGPLGPAPELPPRVLPASTVTSKTGLFPSVLAGLYEFGTDMVRRAKDFDEKHKVSENVKAGVATVQAKAQEVDEKLGITVKANKFRDGVVSTASAVDEKFKLSEKAERLSKATSDFTKKAMDSEPVKKSVAALHKAGDKIKSSVGIVDSPPQPVDPSTGEPLPQEVEVEASTGTSDSSPTVEVKTNTTAGVQMSPMEE